ncbi:MAG: glycosyltransferase family 4 protein [Promethearchaeota archaeon]
MKKNSAKQRVIFCTFSDFEAGNQGDSVNDRKLFRAIPSAYEKIALYPKYKEVNKIEIKSLFKYFIKYLNEIVSSNRIFITRAPKLALFPIILKKLFNNKVIIRMGCTPVVFIERRAFARNPEFQYSKNLFKRLFYFLEPHLELYAIRHADRFIIENERAKNMAIFYGADLEKIKIIPYFVQDYFLKTITLNFEKKKDIFKIGYTGRFSLYDLLNPVIDAVYLLKEQGYKIKLFLIGDGITRKSMENYVKTRDLEENIIFLGSKPHREVSDLINQYHCLVLPMLNNICPSAVAIKILEGVMKGKIIITTESGNNVSLFLGNNDLILKECTSNLIAEKIKLVYENYDKYKDISINISKYHRKNRSKQIYREKIKALLNELSF